MQKLIIQGDNPKNRFGHSLTLIIKSKAILFGGAIGDSTQYSITNDTYSLDLLSLNWKKLNPQGKKPTARAAHAACSIGLYHLLIFGGATGGGGLSSDELFILDMKKGDDHSVWSQIFPEGTSPGPRYGHSIILMKQSVYLFGGNSGTESLNDFWCLNLESLPYVWKKIEINQNSDSPSPRAYHAASICHTGFAKGMILIHGGRDNNQKALNDTWGLIKHRNGNWDWIKAPHENSKDVTPSCRYQHHLLFSGTLMLVFGGRKNDNEYLPFEIYNTETSKWYKFLNISVFRNAIVLYEAGIYSYGGFEIERPNIPTNLFNFLDLFDVLGYIKELAEAVDFKELIESKMKKSTLTNKVLSDIKPIKMQPDSPKKAIKKPIKLSENAVITMISNHPIGEKNDFKRIPISHLQEEGKKINPNLNHNQNTHNKENPIFNFSSSQIEDLADYFLNLLMNPKSLIKVFKLSNNMIQNLCQEVLKVFESEPTLLYLKSPTKIFGNLNGKYEDLINLFDTFGYPSDFFGDIERNDYLFLGDYVDRGPQSLELICLLFALKLKYPDQFFLLRGHHEDARINISMGFGEECEKKLKENINDENSIFQKINLVFQHLPLAATIDNKYFCVHGGIGQNLNYLTEIENIKKPTKIAHEKEKITKEQVLINELLWTDPLINNSENSIRGVFGNSDIRTKKFSIERINSFLEKNKLCMIIRSHEFIKEGFEINNQNIITFVSCLDYCGKYKNGGGIIYIKKNSNICPKIIVNKENFSKSTNLNDEKIENEEKKTLNFKNLSPLRK